jgi:hypothetical protein
MTVDRPNGNGALTAKDFKTDQEVRWCPGCGDYAILAAMQGVMPELGIPRERIVFVSGIGCAARFPYYMETYGMHSIHGRASVVSSRMYGRNSSPSFGSVAKSTLISGSESGSGTSQGSEPFARYASESR